MKNYLNEKKMNFINLILKLTKIIFMFMIILFKTFTEMKKNETII